MHDDEEGKVNVKFTYSVEIGEFGEQEYGVETMRTVRFPKEIAYMAPELRSQVSPTIYSNSRKRSCHHFRFRQFKNEQLRQAESLFNTVM